MRILLSGATGFIGKKLGIALTAKGHEIIALVRDKNKVLPFSCEKISWDEAEAQLKDIDAIVHLAGESIADKRWSAKRKKIILESRIETTKKMHDFLRTASGRKAQVFSSASAIGYYGDRGDEILTENAPAGSGFLAEVCKAWEKEIFSDNKMRMVALRFGMVLGNEGGAFAKILPIFKRGFGSKLGSGRQWMSWIHVDDLVNLILFSLENTEIHGVINAVSPEPITNTIFTKKLCIALGVKEFFPVPSFILKIILGEMSTLVLASQRVIPEKILKLQFSFRFPTINLALNDLTKKI